MKQKLMKKNIRKINRIHSINLYYYELNIIEIEKFAKDFNEIILNLFDFNYINKNNSNINSINGINLKRNCSFEEIIRKEFDSSLKNNQN